MNNLFSRKAFALLALICFGSLPCKRLLWAAEPTFATKVSIS